jgi:hypothetical protein
VVADALSRMGYVNAIMVSQMPQELCEEFEWLNLGFVTHTEGITIEVEPTLEQDIQKGQLEDPKIQEVREMIEAGKAPDFIEDEHGTVWFRKRICVPDVDHLREKILQEAYDSAYSIHPGSAKMYKDLKVKYWWYGMKRDVAAHVALCDVCQRVKAEHQRSAGLLQPLKVLEWKWEEIGMDFIVGLPRTRDGYDSIWVIVDRLTKVAQSRQKSYADTRRRELTFEEGDYVYLKVSPIRGLRRFKVKGKLSPRYIGPFKILERKGEVAYQLELPARLSDVHNVFHISQLKKCLRVPEEQLPLEELDVQKDLTYEEHLIKILDTAERITQSKRIRMCRV